MLYKCNRCHKEFKQKSNYTYHTNRKNPCKNNNEIITSNINTEFNMIPNLADNIPNLSDNSNIFYCNMCNNTFTTTSALSRHKKNRCKKNKLIIQLQKLEEENKKLNNKITILEEENILLKKQIILLPKTNIQNQNIQNQNIQNNITINFGDEDMNKLTEEEILKSLKSLSNCFQDFDKTVHLNSRLPEYNNILINNMRSNYGYIIEDNKFITKDKYKIIADLISMRVYDMKSLSVNYKNKLNTRELSFIKDIIVFLKTAYIESEDGNGNIIKGEKTSAKKLKDVYNQLLYMFYDNKDIIKIN